MVRVPKLPLSIVATVSKMPASASAQEWAVDSVIRTDLSRWCRCAHAIQRALTPLGDLDEIGCRPSIEACGTISRFRPPLPRTGVGEESRGTPVRPAGFQL